MNTKIPKPFFVLFLVVAFSSANAVAVFGGTDCGKWTTQPSQGRQWLVGFMSGMNVALATATDDPLDKLSSADQIFVWMDKYCRDNPLDRVGDGGQKLYQELMRRKK